MLWVFFKKLISNTYLFFKKNLYNKLTYHNVKKFTAGIFNSFKTFWEAIVETSGINPVFRLFIVIMILVQPFFDFFFKIFKLSKLRIISVYPRILAEFKSALEVSRISYKFLKPNVVLLYNNFKKKTLWLLRGLIRSIVFLGRIVIKFYNYVRSSYSNLKFDYLKKLYIKWYDFMWDSTYHWPRGRYIISILPDYREPTMFKTFSFEHDGSEGIVDALKCRDEFINLRNQLDDTFFLYPNLPCSELPLSSYSSNILKLSKFLHSTKFSVWYNCNFFTLQYCALLHLNNSIRDLSGGHFCPIANEPVFKFFDTIKDTLGYVIDTEYFVTEMTFSMGFLIFMNVLAEELHDWVEEMCRDLYL